MGQLKLRLVFALFVTFCLSSSALAAVDIDEWFKKTDLNHNNKIERKEFTGSDTQWTVGDENRDNVLSLAECKRGLHDTIVSGKIAVAEKEKVSKEEIERRKRAFEDWFKTSDKNGNSLVELKEFKGDIKHFNRADRNRDDKLTRTEARRNPWLWDRVRMLKAQLARAKEIADQKEQERQEDLAARTTAGGWVDITPSCVKFSSMWTPKNAPFYRTSSALAIYGKTLTVLFRSGGNYEFRLYQSRDLTESNESWVSLSPELIGAPKKKGDLKRVLGNSFDLALRGSYPAVACTDYEAMEKGSVHYSPLKGKWNVVGKRGISKKWEMKKVFLSTLRRANNKFTYFLWAEEIVGPSKTAQPVLYIKYDDNTPWVKALNLETKKYSSIYNWGFDKDRVAFFSGGLNIHIGQWHNKNIRNWKKYKTKGVSGSLPRLCGNYVAYRGPGFKLKGYEAYVRRYVASSNSWPLLGGNKAISPTGVYGLDLCLGKQGRPYIVYVSRHEKWNTRDRLSVKRWTGSEWVYVGEPKFSKNLAAQPRIVYSSQLEKIFVSFYDMKTKDMTIMMHDEE